MNKMVNTTDICMDIIMTVVCTVPLKSKLPPSRETRVSSLETSVSSRETSLSSLETRVSSLETRRSSRETVQKTVSVCINENFPKINRFTKTLALQT